MKQKLLYGFGFIALIGLCALVYSLVRIDPAKAPSDNNRSSSSQSVDLKSTSKTVAVVGTVKCLTPSDNSATQASSCAVGLQQDDGGAYALNAQDPTTTGSLPTGQRVKVTGVVTPKATQYKANGVIQVQTVTPL